MALSSSKNLSFTVEQFNEKGNFILWQERETLGLTDPAEVWEKLKSQYKSKSLTVKLHIKKQFYDLWLSEGGSFEKHLDDFNQIITQMSALDEVIKEEDKYFKWKYENAEKEKGEKGRSEDKSSVSVVTRSDLLVTCEEKVANLTDEESAGLNIILVSRLDDEGYCNTFCDCEWKLTRGFLVVARGKRCFGLYILKAFATAGDVNAVIDKKTENLWHSRLGHMSENGLNHLVRKGLIAGVKEDGLRTCPHCLAGKQRRVSFLRDLSTPKIELFELVYTDVCGLFKEKSYGEAQYFISFIDDCSRKLWFYPLKTKDQAETLKTTAYIINRSSSKLLKGEVQENTWSNNEPSYDHLQVFGCKAFVHVLRDEITKLEPNTMQCIFLGYREDELGYRFYDPTGRIFIRSRDVTFIENETIKDISRNVKCGDDRTDKISIKIICSISLEDGDNGPEVADHNGEEITTPDEG
ncbi:hypothetical protein Nepgr_024458 [Nepenthes gracilis]|uniref:GAG-pre-integrase domain-containing protein n=1 Tax=Nepenthes gracilis TaxID=150966 RepID=A0AAD3T4A4_NEPGR|nr:hypothetical protein Nepgr_024458 [Nepenthes gracilis]